MNNRQKIILAVLVVVAVLIIGWFLWLMFRPTAPAPLPGNVNEPTLNIEVEAVAPIPPATPERQQEEREYPLGLKQVASTFAERYLSYSSDQPNKNLEDLQPLMTLKMQATARELIDANFQTEAAPGFVGYSAKSLSTELVQNNETSAEVRVSLQRIQYSGDNPGPNVFYQEMVLKFVKIGSDWRVDSVVVD